MNTVRSEVECWVALILYNKCVYYLNNPNLPPLHYSHTLSLIIDYLPYHNNSSQTSWVLSYNCKFILKVSSKIKHQTTFEQIYLWDCSTQCKWCLTRVWLLAVTTRCACGGSTTGSTCWSTSRDMCSWYFSYCCAWSRRSTHSSVHSWTPDTLTSHKPSQSLYTYLFCMKYFILFRKHN